MNHNELHVNVPLEAVKVYLNSEQDCIHVIWSVFLLKEKQWESIAWQCKRKQDCMCVHACTCVHVCVYACMCVTVSVCLHL